MALPREPRQKMINIMYLVLTAILALNVSAEVINAFRTVNKSLTDSNTNIEKSNSTLFSSLADNVADPKTAEKAKIWAPLADKAKQYSEDVYNYIEGLKKLVKKQSDLKVDANGNPVLDANGNEDFKEDYLEASTRVFEKNGEGKVLYQKLNDYITSMLGIDPKIDSAFKTSFPVDMRIPPTHSGNARTGNAVTDWTASYFHMTPAIAALTMLSKFQNNVKNAENQVVTYCQNQIGKVVVHMDKVSVLVGQSSNYLMPGQELTVTAGVGAYSSAANPRISINGSGVPVTDGQGTYKTTASGAGEHSVSVNVVFKDENGKDVEKTETVKYVVGVPGGAAVMLDKMNVFYIGVPNPITISSGSGWDKTTVSMTGGTISGSGSNRVVTVSTIGTASITVTADGKPSKFDFRVKRIPDPIIKVGPSGGGRMAAAIFRVQQFVAAVLENFDFDAHFSVTGATIYFNNPGDRNVKQVTISSGSLAPAKQYMDQLVPGSTVTFDNIRVVGPDGQTRTIQNPPGFSLF